MKIFVKYATRMLIALFLLAAGFAAGYPAGQRTGFATGTEWALLQADILAREAGVTMPVFYENDEFKIVLRQPRNLHRTAWKLADRFDINTGAAPELDARPAEDDTEQALGRPLLDDLVLADSAKLATAASATAGPAAAPHQEQTGICTF